MKEKNTYSYVAFDGHEVYLSDNLFEIFEQIIENCTGDRKANKKAYPVYAWYLPAPTLYTGFDRNGITNFGPLDEEGKRVGIPLWLDEDPHNKRIVQIHMEQCWDRISVINEKLKNY